MLFVALIRILFLSLAVHYSTQTSGQFKITNKPNADVFVCGTKPDNLEKPLHAQRECAHFIEVPVKFKTTYNLVEMQQC